MRRSLLGLALVTVAACSEAPDDETPSGALRMFLDAMERSSYEPAAQEDAYRLLSEASRRQLEERASSATALSGREFEPWQMLVQGRYRLRFTPRAMDEEIDGDTALVTVRGSGEGQRAEVPLVREDGRWRIKLELPPAGRNQP
jgi:hypothetical protein